MKYHVSVSVPARWQVLWCPRRDAAADVALSTGRRCAQRHGEANSAGIRGSSQQARCGTVWHGDSHPLDLVEKVTGLIMAHHL